MAATLTPQTRFFKSDYAVDHLKWSRSDLSKAALEAALAQMAMDNTGANLMLLEGAARFVRVLLNLSEVESKTLTENRSTLQPPPSTLTK